MTWLVVACFVAGGAAAWLTRGVPFRDAGGEPDPAVLAAMSRDELEAEVRRLRARLDQRDKQLADLMIELKLLTEGSGRPAMSD